MGLLRIDKIIASCGLASRREVKNLIKNGRISVNDVTVCSPDEKYDPEKVRITVDEKDILYKTRHVVMLNKPAGYITATEDLKEKTVLQLLDDEYRRMRLFPVGRLDKDTEGLLLLTDDGTLCHNVISPSKEIAKVYYVETDKKLDKTDCTAFEEGVLLSDGQQCLPAMLKITENKGKQSGYILVYEGKYHQVKRMMAARGKKVLYLKRVTVGGLRLDDKLKKGDYRELSENEIELIFDKRKMMENFRHIL